MRRWLISIAGTVAAALAVALVMSFVSLRDRVASLEATLSLPARVALVEHDVTALQATHEVEQRVAIHDAEQVDARLRWLERIETDRQRDGRADH